MTLRRRLGARRNPPPLDGCGVGLTAVGAGPLAFDVEVEMGLTYYW